MMLVFKTFAEHLSWTNFWHMMFDLNQVRFDLLNKEQLTILMDWAAEEGWNPGIYDIEAFWAADHQGYMGCFLGEELIAGGSIVSYSGAYGFMGLFIVKPGYRGKGIGQKLWYLRRQKLLDKLSQGAPIGMDGVVAMQPFYEKGGFRIAFRDERYESVGQIFPLHANIMQALPSEEKELYTYDQSCFGFDRSAFLKKWLQLPESRVFVYKDKTRISGYAVLRKSQSGFKVGPLFANSPDVAEALYQACLNSVPDELVYMDIPMNNMNALSLMTKYGATSIFECARMYHGPEPQIDMNRVYGITTFELG